MSNRFDNLCESITSVMEDFDAQPVAFGTDYSQPQGYAPSEDDEVEEIDEVEEPCCVVDTDAVITLLKLIGDSDDTELNELTSAELGDFFDDVLADTIEVVDGAFGVKPQDTQDVQPTEEDDVVVEDEEIEEDDVVVEDEEIEEDDVVVEDEEIEEEDEVVVEDEEIEEEDEVVVEEDDSEFDAEPSLETPEILAKLSELEALISGKLGA